MSLAGTLLALAAIPNLPSATALAASPPLFGNAASYPVGQYPRTVAVGDFNGDGTPDLVSVDDTGNGLVSVLLGRGDGSFQQAINSTAGPLASCGARSLAVGDFNKDGKADLVVSDWCAQGVSILLGNGNGTFGAPTFYSAGGATGGGQVAVGDFNKDGSLDLVLVSVGSNSVSVFLGNGDGTFRPAVLYAAGSAPTGVVVGDFNNDGNLDLAVDSGAGVSVLQGKGDGTFGSQVTFSAIGYGAIAMADINGDGKLDLAVAGQGGGSVLLGNGDATFRAPLTFTTDANTQNSIAVGDFDRDGKLDVVVGNTGTVQVYLGNGDGTFQSLPTSYNVGSGPVGIARADLNGDNKLDLAVANFWSNTVSVMLGGGLPPPGGCPVPVAVTAGFSHMLALNSDGTVWGWGFNGDGELGNGTFTAATTPVQVPGLTSVTAISAGGFFSLALKANGTVWAWGDNSFGQLGNGGTSLTPTATPAQVLGLTGVVAISAGRYHALALESDGTVWSWGDDLWGQVGVPPPPLGVAVWPSPQKVVFPAGTGRLTAIAGGGYHSIALRSDGIVLAWGDNSFGQLGMAAQTSPSNLRAFADAYDQPARSGARRASRQSLSNIALAPAANSFSPQPVRGLSFVTALSAGLLHSMALKVDGTLWGWGSNFYGQLGNGTTSDSATPVQALSGVAAIAGANRASLAIRSDGSVWQWGYNYPVVPTQIPVIAGATGVAGGDEETLAVDRFATVWQWGMTIVAAPKQVAGVAGATAISAGGHHNLAVTPVGTYAWGWNADGQLGGSDFSANTAPILIQGAAFSTVSAGGYHSLAVSGASPGTVVTWGGNGAGQLGNGQTVERNSLPGPTNPTFAGSSIAAGGFHSLSLRPSDGNVLSWGNNSNGQLGIGLGTTKSNTPVVVGPNYLGVTRVAAGAYHSLELLAGNVWGWGYNGDGELGNGGTTDASFPVAGPSFNNMAVSISAGAFHSLALVSTVNGRFVFAWGYNGDGELGNGTTSGNPTPNAVPTNITPNVLSISAGAFHNLALLGDGTVWAWGANDYGQLGNGSTARASTPIQVQGLPANIRLIAAGREQSLAVDSTGAVWQWGAIYAGTPFAVSGFSNALLPFVTAVGPTSGAPSGGTTVTITGKGFTNTSAVYFGAIAATSFTVNSDTQITATSPAGTPGTVNLRVFTPGCGSAAGPWARFTYGDVMSVVSGKQYVFPNSDGATWVDIDGPKLALFITPTVNSQAILSGNADLWTANAGVNQDLGISVNDATSAWKESGGFAGTFSPNAAFVQSVIPMTANTTYVVKLRWKTNRPASGATIFAAAGGGPDYSPTRLTAELVPATSPNLQSVATNSQYLLNGNNGGTWKDIDATNLVISNFTPAGTTSGLVSANVDLWTTAAGINQDVGIWISGGTYGSGTLVGWKESGGYGGTYSPNAAFVQTLVTLTATQPYTIRLQWKTNKPTSSTIVAAAGAGPVYSPTRLTLRLFPTANSLVDATTNKQFNKAGSTGSDWTPIDGTGLTLTVNPTANSLWVLSGNADLWTSTVGVNQDIGIFVSGGAYGSGTLVAWKESGGYGGTFSPNAAFVQTVIPLAMGVNYTITLEWKANKATGGTIYAAAGSGPAPNYSPTRITAQLLG